MARVAPRDARHRRHFCRPSPSPSPRGIRISESLLSILISFQIMYADAAFAPKTVAGFSNGCLESQHQAPTPLSHALQRRASTDASLRDTRPVPAVRSLGDSATWGNTGSSISVPTLSLFPLFRGLDIGRTVRLASTFKRHANERPLRQVRVRGPLGFKLRPIPS